MRGRAARLRPLRPAAAARQAFGGKSVSEMQDGLAELKEALLDELNRVDHWRDRIADDVDDVAEVNLYEDDELAHLAIIPFELEDLACVGVFTQLADEV